MLTALESRAISLKPGPDVYIERPDKRFGFLEAIRRTCASVTVQASPFDPRHAAYVRRAQQNRSGCIGSAQKDAPSAATGHGSAKKPDGDLCGRASLAAFKTVSRFNLPWWAEREDLVNLGCVAILEAGATDEPLAIAIAHRAMVSYLRAQERRQRDREWPADDVLDSERYDSKAPAGSGRDSDLWEALKALPPRQHTATRLYLEGCGYEEIAQRMDTTPKSVERLLAHARTSMKEFLTHSGGFERS